MPRAPRNTNATHARGGSSSRPSRPRGRGGASRSNRNPLHAAISEYTPYQPPNFPPEQNLRFPSIAESFDESLLDRQGIIRSIHFGPDFSVSGTHMDAISSRPELCDSLLSLTLGDSDTSYGGYVDNESVMNLVEACSNLRVLSLDSCGLLDDTTFGVICQSCPQLESLRLTGNDKGKGRLSDKALKQLTESPACAPNLRELVLYDQALLRDTVWKQLTRARPNLALMQGDTVGDSMSSRMGGDGMTTTWYKGQMVGIDVDDGGFGFGGY